MDSFMSDLNDACTDYDDAEEKSHKDGFVSPQDLPELPRDWKVKLREKILRNVEASLHEVHIRCEVAERNLDFCHQSC